MMCMSGLMRSARNRMLVSYHVDQLTDQPQSPDCFSHYSAPLDDAQVAKALVSLLLTLNARQKSSVKIVSTLTDSSCPSVTVFV